MIVFLTLLYVGVLALAVKVGLVKLSLFWKLSPLLWMLLLFIILFLPMQWGAPSGDVNVYRNVVEVIPNVNGEVIDVPVEPLKPLEKGDVLFRIDPVPFQAQVDQLKAQLEATIQNVEQLKASAEAAEATVARTQDEIEIAKQQVKQESANVIVAETSKEQAEADLVKATSLVTDAQIQADAANREFGRQKELLANGAGSESDTDRAEVQFTSLLSQLHSAQADLKAKEEALTGSIANIDATKAQARGVELQLKQLVGAELPRVKALASEAEIAANSMIGDEHTSVARVRAQLAEAQYNLDQTTVTAPSKGRVAYLTLRPGQRVASFPVRSWMAFVDDQRTEIVMLAQQFAIRNVKPGQPAEVTFKIRPGEVFPATVDRIAYMSAAGQLQPSGQLASTNSMSSSAEPYGVVLTIDNKDADQTLLAGGAKGSAAIYTESMKATHVIRRVMLRMDAWMNYIIP